MLLVNRTPMHANLPASSHCVERERPGFLLSAVALLAVGRNGNHERRVCPESPGPFRHRTRSTTQEGWPWAV